MLDVEIAKKINWYKNDVDSIYHSSIEPIEPKWLNSLKEFIENEYHVRIMTLAYDEKSDKVYIIFYDFTDWFSFYKQCNISWLETPVEVNKKAIELSTKKTIQCRICSTAFVPAARHAILSSVAKQYEREILEIFLKNKPKMYFWHYYVIIFEAKEQAAEFLRSDHRQQMHKRIFEIAKSIDKYGVIKESDVHIFADYQAHFDQMEGHYHQWLEELKYDEMNNYENMLAMI